MMLRNVRGNRKKIANIIQQGDCKDRYIQGNPNKGEMKQK